MVAGVCRDMDVPHSTLTVQWQEKPTTRLQERTRQERYRLLDAWATERGLSAVATAHHLDDQAETLVMRLNRGAGVRGLAGMRPDSTLPVPGSTLRLLRPLLGWRRSELEEVCAAAGLRPAYDPSNSDDQFERVRFRTAIANADWVDVEAVGKSAGYLAEADTALEWSADQEWKARVTEGRGEIVYRPHAPAEIRRRIVNRAVTTLANEGDSNLLRGRELDQLLQSLVEGRKSTLRGVLCAGGEVWRFSAAPSRRS